MWRYRRHGDMPMAEDQDLDAAEQVDANAALWDVLGAVTAPVMLVRGMRPQSVVDDADEAELLRRLPSARVEHVAEAGHSVQGDTPVELAALIDSFVFA
jgi:pimeloyl-ACP methyl ester carboxylesterase